MSPAIWFCAQWSAPAIETILIYPCFTDENVEVQGSEWLAQSHVNIK